jgi:hypothetical protein
MQMTDNLRWENYGLPGFGKSSQPVTRWFVRPILAKSNCTSPFIANGLCRSPEKLAAWAKPRWNASMKCGPRSTSTVAAG